MFGLFERLLISEAFSTSSYHSYRYGGESSLEEKKTCLSLSLDHPLAFARFIRLVKGWVTTFEDRQWVNWSK
jgi:hypothetical protein